MKEQKKYVISSYTGSGYSRTERGGRYLKALIAYTSWQPIWEHDALLFALEKVLYSSGARTHRPIDKYARETLSHMIREQVIDRVS